MFNRFKSTGNWAEDLGNSIYLFIIFGCVSFVVAVIAIIALIVAVLT